MTNFSLLCEIFVCLSLMVAVVCSIDVFRFEVESKAKEIGSDIRNILKEAVEMNGQDKKTYEEGKKPTFCHGLDCPDFREVSKTDNYELREYKASRWVSTNLLDISYGPASRQMFMKLFHYIEGENAEKEKIAMTAPVINRVIPGQGPACKSNFTMSFFIAPKVAKPPHPSEKGVFLSELPKQRVFVSHFGGEATERDWIEHARALVTALTKDKRKFDGSHFYTAGYDSPFRLINRHNEIWYIAQE